MVKAKEILNEFSHLIKHIAGPLETQIARPCSVDHPQKNGLIYLHKSDFFSRMNESHVAAIVIDSKLKIDGPYVKDKVYFSCDQLQLAMALINQKLFPINGYADFAKKDLIHPTAVISTSAKIGKNTKVGPHVYIGDNVTVGNDCIIGANTVIETEAQIKDRCHLHALVYIGHNCVIGNDCIVQSNTSIGSNGFGYGTDKNRHHYLKPHYGRVVLHDRVEIGANVAIDRGVFDDSILGEGTKVDNHCHFGHNFICGKNCLITAKFLTAGSVVIGDNFICGGRVAINGHTAITDNVTIAAMSASAGNVTKPGMYGGWPLQEFNDSRKSLASFPGLPKIRKELARIKKKLNMDDNQ